MNSTRPADTTSTKTDARTLRVLRNVLPLAVIAGLAACDEDPTVPETPIEVSSQTAFAVPLFIQDENGSAPTDDQTPLHEIRLNTPVRNPNGEQVRLADWNAAAGTVTVACETGGTRITANWTGLIPNGVYTMWSVVLEPGFDGTLEGLMGSLTGLGAMGDPSGSENSFSPDSDGNASVTILQRAGQLSMMGSIGACALDEYEYHVVASYHIDGMTYGPDLGPDGTAVEHGGAIFKD